MGGQDEMTIYEQLLQIQEHDTTLDQLEHRKAGLAQREELQRNAVARRELDQRISQVSEERDALVRDQKRLEDEAAQVEDKASHEESALYSGTVTSPKELQALQEEVDSLRRRQRQLEDRQLDLMEQIEPLSADLDDLQAQQAVLVQASEELTASLAEAEAELDEQMESERSAREAAVAEVDEQALADYESRKARLGGVGIARLTDGVCGGCHLKLPAVERDRVRRLPPDEQVTCEECGRLLVR